MRKILFIALIFAMLTLTVSCDFLAGPCTEHKFDNACDTDCNSRGCEYVREVPHVYDHACDGECNTEGCGEVRETEHVYNNACDKTCNTEGCGNVRKTTHVYDHACDDTCNVPGCGYERSISHVYDSDCDDACNIIGCGQKREPKHTFDNAYDKDCNTAGCDYEREIKRQAVILLGQSNMAGRGDLSEVEPMSDDRIFMMRDDMWVKMEEPIHTDKDIAGVGLAASFAKGFVDSFGCEVGLVPAAMGGSSLADWGVGGELYNEALRLIKLAMQDSEVCAILWHQGEANQNDKSYAMKLRRILDSLIAQAGLDESQIVIVTGELFGTRSDEVHRDQLDKLADYYTNYGIAESDGLTVFDETTHFDSPSLRVFGYRYFAIFYNFVTGGTYQYNDDPNSYYKTTA